MKKLGATLFLVLSLWCSLDAGASTLVFGVSLGRYPGVTSDQQALAAYQPLVTWLEQKLQQKIVLSGYRSYAELEKKLKDNIYSFAYTKVDVYARVRRVNPTVQPIAVVVTRDANGHEVNSYSSAIVSLKSNRAIQSVSDLKGKRIGFTNRISASGFIYPVQYLKTKGMDYQKDLASHFFYGDDQPVIQALLLKKIDAAACWQGYLRLLPQSEQKKINILISIPRIPNPMYAASGRMSPAAQRRLAAVLVKAPAALFSRLLYQRLAPVPENFYAHVL